jgi:hypothetical protein
MMKKTGLQILLLAIVFFATSNLLMAVKLDMDAYKEAMAKRYKHTFNKDYDPLKKYVHLEISNKGALLTWDAIENIPTEDMVWNTIYGEDENTALDNAKTIGYLIYVYDEANITKELPAKEMAEDPIDPSYENVYFTQNSQRYDNSKCYKKNVWDSGSGALKLATCQQY